MEEIRTKYLIIGAGLSGLTSAYKLFKKDEEDFLVLESRERIGGRLITKDHIDFGATWFQGYHEGIVSLLNELGVSQFKQYSEGKSVLVYNTMAPAHYFQSDPDAVPASRISGGSSALIEALANPIKDRIRLNQNVHSIDSIEEGLLVKTDNCAYRTKKVIVTIPPRIATRILFSPELPSHLSQVMEDTHTWMSNAIKIGMTFKGPFWRKKNLSGTLIGQVGPVVELYDHSDQNEEHFALMGFVNETLRDASEQDRKKHILDYLANYLGDEVRGYLTYEEKDWSQDLDTSCETIKSLYMSPQYGHPIFQESFLDDRVIFSGAETSPVHGGYMDGAVYSGVKSALRILS